MKTSRHYASRIFYSTLALCALFVSGALFAQGTLTLVLPDGDYPHDIYLAEQLTINVAGNATISGRITSATTTGGFPTGGAVVKAGQGTLTITGSDNLFYGPNRIEEGKVVATTAHAIGTGAWDIAPGNILEFRGVAGTMRQSFIGGGNIEITESSDITFNWRNGTLDDYEDVGTTVQPASNLLASITVTDASCFSAIASGTYSSVLGGSGAYVVVTEGSTLVLGREGISSHGTGGTSLPIAYPIYAQRVDLTGGSALILNPNAFLNTGALLLLEHSAISFGASGVSRIRWQEGTAPEDFNYILPEGMSLIINELPVPTGFYREFVVFDPNSLDIQPISQTVAAGQNAFFSATVTANDSLMIGYDAYQWQSSPDGNTWTDISGATSATLTLNAVTTAMDGSLYRCDAIAYFWESPITPISLTSNVAMLTVNAGGKGGGNSGGNSSGRGGGGGAPSLLWLGAVAAMVALRKKAK